MTSPLQGEVHQFKSGRAQIFSKDLIESTSRYNLRSYHFVDETMKKKGDYERYVILGLSIFLVLLSFLILKPLISSLLGGIMLGYIFSPLNNLVLKVIKNKTWTALIITILILMLIVVPSGFLLNSLTSEAKGLGSYITTIGQDSVALANVLEIPLIKSIVDNPQVQSYTKGFADEIAPKVGDWASGVLGAVSSFILNLFVMFFATFYFIKDGNKIFNKFQKYLPIKTEHKKKFIKRFKEVTDGTIYGSIIVALVQAIIAFIGFIIFNVNSPLLWGIVIFILSLLPIIGPPIVYIPIGLFKIFDGIIKANPTNLWNGIGLLIWGFILISQVDNLIRYTITSSKSKVHPMIVLVGILGGIPLLGVVGIFYGPLILIFAITMMEIYHPK